MNRDLSKFKEYLENCLEISMKNNWGLPGLVVYMEKYLWRISC